MIKEMIAYKKILLSLLFLTIALQSALAQGTDSSGQEPLQGLKSEDPIAQIKACREIAKSKNEAAIPLLINLLENSPDREVQWNSAVALGLIAKPGQSTSALIKSARAGSTKSVRYASLVALASIQDESVKREYMELINWTLNESNDELAKDLIQKIKSKVGL